MNLDLNWFQITIQTVRACRHLLTTRRNDFLFELLADRDNQRSNQSYRLFLSLPGTSERSPCCSRCAAARAWSRFRAGQVSVKIESHSLKIKRILRGSHSAKSAPIFVTKYRDEAEVGSRKPPRPPPKEKLTWTHSRGNEDHVKFRHMLHCQATCALIN